MIQRGRIQEESMYYEHKKRDGSLPVIGVGTFLQKDRGGEIELIRSTEEEKGAQIANVNAMVKRGTRWLQMVSRCCRTRRKIAATCSSS